MRSKKDILDAVRASKPEHAEDVTDRARIEALLDIRDLLCDAIHPVGPRTKTKRQPGPPPWRSPTSVKCSREADLSMAIARTANLASFLEALLEEEDSLTEEGLQKRLSQIGVEALEVFRALGLKIR